MHVYMRVYVFLRISSSCVCNMYVFEYVCMTAWFMELEFGTPVKQSRLFIHDDFHENWYLVWDCIGILIFWKMSVVALTFVNWSYSSLNNTQISYID